MGAEAVQQPVAEAVPAASPLLPPAPPAPPPAAPAGQKAQVAGPARSPAMQAYFEALHGEAMRCYAIAKQARRKGKDPTLEVEIPPAEDLAARVEAQVGPPGVAQQVRDATARLGNREVVSLQVAQDVAEQLSRAGASKTKALDQAVRTGLSILTEGVLVAPLEGIADVKIGLNGDGTDYVDLYFAGPIRAAGGTAQAMSVLIADLVRRRLGIGTYKATDDEVERYKEEIAAYKVEAHLQYNPTPAEIELIARSCPVCINGEGTERSEVSGNRDLPRVETNQLRGGACLVMAEGMILKAPKILKHVEKLKVENWDFLSKLIKKEKAAEVAADGIPEIPANSKFMLEILAGRPVFSQPGRVGGFRLRYGRARTAGLASNAFHPATMAVLDDFLAVGTQLKVERPGKGTVATPCDTIEGPTVLLVHGNLVRLTSIAHVKEVRTAIKEIVDVGEILVPFGEFAENNAVLPPSSWCWEWWVQVHQKMTGTTADVHPPGTLTGAQMVRLAEDTQVPLHPDGTLLWHDVTAVQMRHLGDWMLRHAFWGGPPDDAATAILPAPPGDALWVESEPDAKATLVSLLALHTVHGRWLRIEERLAHPLLRGVGLDLDTAAGKVRDTPRRRILHDPCQPDLKSRFPTVELASRLSGYTLMPRAPFRIGGRMGRPEKADARRMSPPPHGLFPIGQAGGAQRLLRDAADQGTIEVELGSRKCAACGRGEWRTFCAACGGHTELHERKQKEGAFNQREMTALDLKAELERARQALGLDRLPEKIKAVLGVSNAEKVPEPLEKALLRAKHEVYVFKDGTTRFDMTDVPLTHFRPCEVGTPVAKLVAMGYTHDLHGEPLTRDDQMLELRVQDIVVSESCGDYLLRTAQFMDDLLVRFYGLKPYYNATHRRDMVGHLTIALAPHTSGGVLSRIIGYTKAQCHFGHPYFHAAKRRNCLAPDTAVFTLNSPAPVRRSLETLFHSGGPETPIDEAGTVARALEGVRVLAADPATGAVEPRRAVRALRIPSPAHLLRFTTRQGRTWTCSPAHRVEAFGAGRLAKRRAVELRVGDKVPALGRVEVAPAAPVLDLLAAWDARPDLMVRLPAGFLRALVARCGGPRATAERMGTTVRQLGNHVARGSIPWLLLRTVCPPADVPDQARLSRPRDRASVPARIQADARFMRLVGYYLAEGHARSGAVHQVDIAATEPDLVADIVQCAAALVGKAPKPQATRVTLSGRLVHDLFMQVLGTGAGAHAKRLPAALAAAPKPLMAELLRAYFAGDGSVEKGRAHVACHSVSRGLLQDVALQLARFGIASRFSTATRPGGGAVQAHAQRTGRPGRTYTCHRLSVRSTHARTFAREVGFASRRKQDALQASLGSVRSSRLEAFGGLLVDEVAAIETVRSPHPYLYDLEVEGHHNFLLGDLVVTSNCDGDEDGVMLLMDGLVNFSRKFVPDKRGGLMDLPLVLSTRLDPNEVDKEAHNVDTLSRYPLEFYEATQRHAAAKEVAKKMGLVEARIGKPEQYEQWGFTHDTRDISEGPAASAYKTLGSMMDKMTAQMELARKIRAVDEAEVGARVIGTHLLPDLMGNLKAFSRQKVRCPKCNEKYRRMPLKGACLGCGNTNLTLTVHEGSVRKYLQISKEVAVRYKIDAYTHQRILLLEQSVESLFQNDKVKKAKLSDFF